MNANDIRRIINEHPEGVLIKMVDGTKYKVPHRDWVWLTPAFGGEESRFGRFSSCFGVYDGDSLRWVNSLLVAEISPMKARGGGSNGNGHGQGKKPRRKRD